MEDNHYLLIKLLELPDAAAIKHSTVSVKKIFVKVFVDLINNELKQKEHKSEKNTYQ